jgi:hypothetical protein
MLGQEVSYALYGAWRLARLDPAGLGFFDRSREGLIRSFRAAIIVYPFFLLLLVLRVEDTAWQQAGAARVILIETIGYVISWTAYPLATLQLARFLDRTERWPGFIVVYNWSQILQTVLFLAAAALAASGVLPAGLGRNLLLLATIAILLYEWYIARVALDVPGTAATVAVLIDLVIGVLVAHVAEALY